MTLREFIFAVVLASSAVAVTYGVSLIYRPAGWIVGGILGALWFWLMLGDDE